jgi:hypothetical protein
MWIISADALLTVNNRLRPFLYVTVPQTGSWCRRKPQLYLKVIKMKSSLMK